MNRNNFAGKTFTTTSSEATQSLGYDFGKVLEKGDVVCLYGDLGSGKTTFIQGLAEGLGIKNRIISPTFIIVRNYRIKNHESPLRQGPAPSGAGQGFEGQAGIMNFYHIDLYRIENEKDIEGLGLEEILNDPSSIVAIEWAERLKDSLPQKRIDIRFSYEKNDTRKVTFGLTA